MKGADFLKTLCRFFLQYATPLATLGLMIITFILALATSDMAKSTKEMAELTRMDFIYRFTPAFIVQEPVLEEQEKRKFLKVVFLNTSQEAHAKDVTHWVYYYTKDKQHVLVDHFLTKTDLGTMWLFTARVDYPPKRSRWIAIELDDQRLSQLEDIIFIIQFHTPFSDKAEFFTSGFHCERNGKHFEELSPEILERHSHLIGQAKLLPPDCTPSRFVTGGGI